MVDGVRDPLLGADHGLPADLKNAVLRLRMKEAWWWREDPPPQPRPLLELPGDDPFGVVVVADLSDEFLDRAEFGRFGVATVRLGK